MRLDNHDEAERVRATQCAEEAAKARADKKEADKDVEDCISDVSAIDDRHALLREAEADLNVRLFLLVIASALLIWCDRILLAPFAKSVASYAGLHDAPSLAILLAFLLLVADWTIGLLRTSDGKGRLIAFMKGPGVVLAMATPLLITASAALARWGTDGEKMPVERQYMTGALLTFTALVHLAVMLSATRDAVVWARYKIVRAWRVRRLGNALKIAKGASASYDRAMIRITIGASKTLQQQILDAIGQLDGNSPSINERADSGESSNKTFTERTPEHSETQKSALAHP